MPSSKIRIETMMVESFQIKMDFMSYATSYYPRFLDSEVCAYSVDPDQMTHDTLCNQGLHGFTLSQQ